MTTKVETPVAFDLYCDLKRVLRSVEAREQLPELMNRYDQQQAELKKLQKRIDKLRAEQCELYCQFENFDRFRAVRGQLQQMIGERFKHRFKGSELGEAVGVLLEVKRTWCLLDFGDRGEWSILIVELIPASQEQQPRPFKLRM